MTAASGDESAEEVLPKLVADVKAGNALSARNMQISGDAIQELIEAAPRSNGRPVLHEASFGGATFTGSIGFDDVIFRGGTDFGNVTFGGGVLFRGATFERYAGFAGASFQTAAFDRVLFGARADFQDTSWSGTAYFVEATFEEDARFQGPTVFGQDARFDMATFKGDFFGGPTFKADVWFDRATFHAARHLGQLRVTGRMILDGAVFEQRVTVAVCADSLSAAGTEFRSGADIHVQSAVIALDSAAFGAPSTLSSATRDTTYGALLASADDTPTIPRLVSLQGARVADLAIYGVDLRACRFRGAHGLDGVQLEQVLFAETPEGWHRRERRPVPLRWTRRLAIAEEHRWRAERQKADEWWGPHLSVQPSTPNWRESDPPTPHQVAAVYRALRKGQEERKDQPGAGDFYYGEMEMRRLTRGSQPDDGSASAGHATALPLDERGRQDSTRRAPAGEELVLFLYWLTSGYGMRASRALICLGVTVAFSALLLAGFGFERDVSYGRSVLYALESSVSLLRAPVQRLTPGGELVTIALRLLGPLFFGLALLSLRGRVKR